MSLAIFDLDNTLIAGDSDHSWGEFLVKKKLVDAETFKSTNDQFYSDYKNGVLDIYKYQRFALSPLTQHPLEKLHQLRDEFMHSWIEPILLDKAFELIQEHKQKGDTLLVITATNRFVASPIVDKLGIDNLLATEPEFVDNAYTGDVIDTPCYQGGKVIRLRKWLENNAIPMDNSFFYSDSINDLPLLQEVSNPIAVDPCSRLEQEARQRGWKIISLR